MILLSHPMGNANVRAIANSLHQTDLLQSFHTSIAAYSGNVWDQLGRLPALNDFRRRAFPEGLKDCTVQYPFGELMRVTANKMGLKKLTAREVGKFSVDAIYRAHDRKVKSYVSRHSQELRAVYAYEDGALDTFIEARKHGLVCIYDLPIAYWETGRQLMMEEAERRPEWAGTLGGGIMDSAEKTERKVKELELADVVVGPGYFVMDSLPEWAAEKKKIVSPFGSPKGTRVKISPGEFNPNRRLRVLFVGSMGQRKGLGDLFEAMRQLDPDRVELVVLGSQLAEPEFYRKEFFGFRYEPTRSHPDVLQLMAECDVFCLPSIVEGRALVMQEAMSQGLPIIITPNTGGQDLVVPGETGFLVPIRSPEAIAEKIDWFLSHREELPRMGAAAAAHAARYTWSSYGGHVASELSAILGSVTV
ncbi:glycosyltransferase family 4 protein [Neolewinella agarilytica]|uniref:Glycosyl transferases group 1 n=1 Tax=Neolewinella agarilytica TaxID=478744 RepID=A0A1H9GMV7_9BACT|nr:glycosyltransferase family 4 protein [Neolewinella agarilytica]SEQ51467.1 Glycosyl transferases group 1 [Neolewinella agarilytica]